MLENEVFLGGVSSSKMIKVPGNGREILTTAFSGYGIYATNKRIIGTKSTKLGMTRLIPFGTLMTVRNDESKNFEELDRSKDIEIFKNEISRIELIPREFMKTDAGISIYNNNSEIILRIAFANDTDFENIKQLMNNFYPELFQTGGSRIQNTGGEKSENHSTNPRTYSQSSITQQKVKKEKTAGERILALGSLIVGLYIWFFLISYVTSHSGLTDNSWGGFIAGMLIGFCFILYGIGLFGY
jgi:hypothetical protein